MSVNDRFRALPSIEKLLSEDGLRDLPHEVAVWAARQVMAEVRERLRQEPESAPPPVGELRAEVARRAAVRQRPTLRPAINATGVLLHTNLGRATLAPSVAEYVARVAQSHASLEVDEETGGRGSRQAHVAALLCELTGAEAAFVVNNNAAATFLAVAGLTAGREIIISRGQLVEIGGQFRLPDVIESAGAKLIEVGTTNRTRIGDYERAITERTAMLLRVHPSNYQIIGFTEEAPLPELVALGKARGILVGDDIGSGALVDFAPFGLTDEPMAQVSVQAGADIIWFSGDKLLGGPQAGILIGTENAINPLKKHPLARALRPDKLTLAALEGTLRLYQSGQAWSEIPALRRIARPADAVFSACQRLADGLRRFPSLTVEVVRSAAEVGGGSLPGLALPSWAVALSVENVEILARALRQADTPVYGRIEKGRLLLDLRTVEPNEEEMILTTLQEILGKGRR